MSGVKKSDSKGRPVAATEEKKKELDFTNEKVNPIRKKAHKEEEKRMNTRRSRVEIVPKKIVNPPPKSPVRDKTPVKKSVIAKDEDESMSESEQPKSRSSS